MRAIARPRCCKPDRRGNLYPAKERPEKAKLSKKAKQKAEAAASEPETPPVVEAPAEAEPEIAETDAAEAVEAVADASPTDAEVPAEGSAADDVAPAAEAADAQEDTRAADGPPTEDA